MAFADLKSRNRASDIEKLTKQLGDASGANSNNKSDDRYWSPTVDKAGNGSAVIRFLPAKEGEDVPFVRYWDHGFKGPTGLWYIENSRTSIGEDDPVGEYNSKLWNSGSDEDKKIAREQKRRLHFVSNIKVISDPAAKENEGKEFLYRYGKKIFDKVNDQMNPQFEDETAVNPFDFWEGANFRLRIRQVEGYRNYDKSEFDKPSALSDSDDELEAIYNRLYSLKAEISEDKFKSYEDLSKQLNRVLGLDGYTPKPESKPREVAEPRQERARPAPSTAKVESADDDEVPWDSNDDAELDYFKSLDKDD